MSSFALTLLDVPFLPCPHDLSSSTNSSLDSWFPVPPSSSTPAPPSQRIRPPSRHRRPRTPRLSHAPPYSCSIFDNALTHFRCDPTLVFGISTGCCRINHLYASALPSPSQQCAADPQRGTQHQLSGSNDGAAQRAASVTPHSLQIRSTPARITLATEVSVPGSIPTPRPADVAFSCLLM